MQLHDTEIVEAREVLVIVCSSIFPVRLGVLVAEFHDQDAATTAAKY